jgi:sphingomyelin phosphodiesterase 2
VNAQLERLSQTHKHNTNRPFILVNTKLNNCLAAFFLLLLQAELFFASFPTQIMPNSINILTLNCWGLKYLSDHRNARLAHIGTTIANTSPPPDVVGLQECWTQEDFNAICSSTRHILPYTKFYYSGVFGSGLAILSKWPIVESSMFKYPLNGRPTAFFRGDWYVGKGVASAVLRMHDGGLVDVFCTHVSYIFNLIYPPEV